MYFSVLSYDFLYSLICFTQITHDQEEGEWFKWISGSGNDIAGRDPGTGNHFNLSFPKTLYGNSQAILKVAYEWKGVAYEQRSVAYEWEGRGLWVEA